MASAAAFESISESATADCVKTWAAEEAHAQRERVHNVKAMDIYDIKHVKSRKPRTHEAMEEEDER
jgi:hypothetical protein